MSLRAYIPAAALASLLSNPGVALAKNVYVARAGDTLWEIARVHGCPIDGLRDENRIRGSLIQVGQEIQLPARCGPTDPESDAGPARKVAAAAPESGERYVVVAGDTLSAIARARKTTVDALLLENRLSSTRIAVGQELVVPPGGIPRMVPGQSIGRPTSGKLRNPVRLPPGAGYYVRRPERSFGATHVVHSVRRAIGEVRRAHRVHTLAIGDLSAKRGGKITMHASHQSGRDVDLGFYFVRKPKGYPQSFVVATARNLHFPATWKLLTELADSADRPGGVERIFISYDTQKLFYKAARKAGVAEKRLAELLQYPHGKYSTRALVRHEPNHDEHMHVRFKCPPKDKGCH